jgi:adenine deaminase
MNKSELKKLIDTAAGRTPADTVIKNATIACVYSGAFITGDIAISGAYIAGIGEYAGNQVIDAAGRYALPAFIDAHIHIESSYLSPEEYGALLVPHGTGTIIADPHEIVNVRGMNGLRYMMEAAKKTALDIKFMIPSCVPATPFEHSGAVIDAAAMREFIDDENVLGLGEFMDFNSVCAAEEGALDKIMIARAHHKLIDGHSPGLAGKKLSAYSAAFIHTDHECAAIEEMRERITRGMYVLLRHGSACKDLPHLIKGVTLENSRRCVLCSDDRQVKSVFEQGHLEEHLRLCVENGLPPMTALQMATLNAAECFRLYDRGAVTPGRRADITLVEDLKTFTVKQVFIKGALVAENGKYLLPVERANDETVRGSFHVKEFSKEKLRLPLTSSSVYVIDVSGGTVVTGKGSAEVRRDANGDFANDGRDGIAKIAVVERHSNSGRVAVALLRGYGIQRGALAISVAHDSHNIIAVGVSDDDMAAAIERLVALSGGIVLVKDGAVREELPLPLGGLMSDRDGAWVEQKLSAIHEKAYTDLGVSRDVDPLMTLCFMSLPVIPDIKITDSGLFDVKTSRFISVNR